MGELILWVVFVTSSANCSGLDSARIETRPRYKWTEMGAWESAIALKNAFPCAEVEVKKYIAKEYGKP